MWAANVMDIKQTLSKVCSKILEEEGVPKPELKLRGLALRELGLIFQAAQVPLVPAEAGEGAAEPTSKPEKAKKQMQDAMVRVIQQKTGQTDTE